MKNENKFKIRAYQKLAQFLEGHDKELSDIYREQGKKGLVDVPHIGEGIAKKIAELLDTGKLGYLDELKASLPAGLGNFLRIPNMGPKKAVIIAGKFGVKTVAELEKLLKGHKLKDVKGFGEKTEENLLRGIELYKKGQERRMLGEAYPAAKKIMDALRKNRSIIKISAAGSLRRMEETIGDIDILASAADADAKSVMGEFCSMEMVKDVIARGETKSSINTVYGMQADLRVVADESWGAAMQYFTGNKSHNVMIREIAVKKGYKLNEYGLYDGKKPIAGADEAGIYEKLGLQYIPPELRAGGGEIEAAQKGLIPVLVEQGDIRGDLHVHSSHSDGAGSIAEMAEAAKKAGYEYIAITDHSAALTVGRGLDKKRILEELREIDEYNKKEEGIHIFKGAEVDILEDSALDHEEEVLSRLDIVIGSVHRKLNMTKKDMTDRLLAAMDNKYLNIIGHISGRMINRREPYELDYEKIFDRAAKEGIAIEVNSQPARLDMRDIYIKEAVRRGVKLTVNTDSHAADQFRFMLYGVGMARRGWARKEDVINTLPLKDVLKWSKGRRS